MKDDKNVLSPLSKFKFINKSGFDSSSNFS